MTDPDFGYRRAQERIATMLRVPLAAVVMAFPVEELDRLSRESYERYGHLSVPTEYLFPPERRCAVCDGEPHDTPEDIALVMEMANAIYYLDPLTSGYAMRLKYHVPVTLEALYFDALNAIGTKNFTRCIEKQVRESAR